MALVQRPFETYDEYVDLQGRKARTRSPQLLAHLEKNTEHFERIFRTAAAHLRAGAILCLGARTGAESLGAVKAGFIGSLGLDLHPVGSTVLRGDWHDLPFSRHAFANAYCNSLDHCWSLDRLAAEVRRVLVPNGRLYVMATNRTTTVEAWLATSGHEALYWDTSDDVRDALCARGFAPKAAWRHGKWGHYIFGVHP